MNTGHEELLKACKALVSTIEVTGGVADQADGDGVAADPEWVDLHDAYELAKAAIEKAEAA